MAVEQGAWQVEQVAWRWRPRAIEKQGGKQIQTS
jgi:hypothetical protein